ncbi:hypothetical protein [Nocardioides sp. B-3]|uniref:hypothetical protein n=1 Tax=Nocardioides sp. B-3 TaxID=2895565 RepID=UPI002152E458|nr:hypothetical protein [Nocardioides sp. B-3]UUZ59870.1 hypothetical protein LP418_02125 [Nocardioides sp. B-3]
MSIVVAALVRICAYAAALTGFYAVLANFTPKEGAANLGAGLPAFAAIVSQAWGPSS